MLVNINNNAKKQQYREQRTYRIYIASICQPGAIFDYSITAQLKEISDKDIVPINKQIY